MIIRVMLAWAAGCLLITCDSAQACTRADNWERIPNDPGLFFDNKISDSNIAEVAISEQGRAKNILDRTDVKEITRAEAAKFTDGGLAAGGDLRLKYFLVRAVRLVKGGRFTAYRHGSAIYIIHGDLGKPRPSKRSAVVVATDGDISEVFSTCTTAE